MRKKEIKALERRMRKREPSNKTKSPLRGIVKSTTLLIMSTALITHPLNISYTNAHFTDKISSDKIGTATNNILGMRAFGKTNGGTLELAFDIHQFNIEAGFEVDFAQNYLIVNMSLPKGFGFNADDILMDSMKIDYNGELIDISPTEIKTNGNNIKLTFNWSKIEGYIDSDDNAPQFDISGKGTGEGASGLGERFIFVGRGKMPELDREYFEQMDYSYYIVGSQVITIPSGEDGQASYTYRFFVDGEQVPEDEVIWQLSPTVDGVEFDSGRLVVNCSAREANITITARLSSNKYFVDELELELIKAEIIEEIAEEIVEDEEIAEEPVDENGDAILDPDLTGGDGMPPDPPDALDSDEQDDSMKDEDEEDEGEDGKSDDDENEDEDDEDGKSDDDDEGDDTDPDHQTEEDFIDDDSPFIEDPADVVLPGDDAPDNVTAPGEDPTDGDDDDGKEDFTGDDDFTQDPIHNGEPVTDYSGDNDSIGQSFDGDGTFIQNPEGSAQIPTQDIIGVENTVNYSDSVKMGDY